MLLQCCITFHVWNQKEYMGQFISVFHKNELKLEIFLIVSVLRFCPLDPILVFMLISCWVINLTCFFFAESSHTSVELPPEFCSIIMSPISISSVYSYSFVPSIMHQLEALLIAASLKRIVLDHCTQNVIIPTVKVLY